MPSLRTHLLRHAVCEEVAVRETPHRRLCASRICTCALRGVQSVDLQRRVCTHARRTSVDSHGLLLLYGGASLLLHGHEDM